MKNFSLKALGAFIFAAGLVVAGVAAPAQATVAATASMSVSSFTANSTVSAAVTLSFTDSATTNTSTYAQISLVTLSLPSGCQTTNTPSVCGIYSIYVNGAVAPAGTSIEKVNPGIFKVVLPSATIISSMSVTFSANQLNVGSSVGNADVTWQAVNGGTNVATSGYTVIANSGGGSSMVSFTGTGTLVDTNSSPITNVAVSSGVPAFTISGSSFTNSATYSKVGVLIYRTSPSYQSYEYFTLTNTVSTTATPGAWSPNSATCGVTAISLGGTPQTGSSGILCQKESWAIMNTTGYAIRVFLPSENSGSIAISVADNVFTSATAGTYGARLSMTSATVNGSFFSGGASVSLTAGGSNSGSQPPSSASASLTMGAQTGGVVAGSSVGISASGLQSTAPYTVTVQSTPQTIGSGNAVNGAVSTNVTLPSGLEAGWHTLTFTSTASDGSAVESKYYFKVSASGTLLATSTTIPAELANTGVDSTSAILLLAGGLSLALVGAEMFMIARRKRSN